jgi:flavin reductase (DIM6/NTAB) family NADH-FMN oxidoreductase RutF
MQEQAAVSEAWERKFPEQVVMVTTVSPDGQPNIITLGWAMPTSNDPLLCAISIGLTRYSHELLEGVPEFVLAFPAEDMEKAMMLCGTRSGRDVDKFQEAELTAIPAAIVRPPLIGEAVTNMECRAVSTHLTGDHTIFVGEIVAAHHSTRRLRRLYNLGGGKFDGL